MTRSLARNDRKRDVEDAVPYGVQQSYGDGGDAVPYNSSLHPSAGGRCPHIAPPDKCAFCGRTHGSRPTGYAGHAGRDVGTPSPTTAHRTRPQGAIPTHRPAGQMRILRRDTWVPPYRVRRSCRTGRRGRRPLQRLIAPIRRGAMPTHRPAGSTKRQAQAPASLCVMRLFTWRSWRPHDRRGRPSDSAP